MVLNSKNLSKTMPVFPFRHYNFHIFSKKTLILFLMMSEKILLLENKNCKTQIILSDMKFQKKQDDFIIVSFFYLYLWINKSEHINGSPI